MRKRSRGTSSRTMPRDRRPPVPREPPNCRHDWKPVPNAVGWNELPSRVVQCSKCGARRLKEG